MSLNAHERETVINASDGDELVRVLTHQPKFLGRLRRDERFTEVRSGNDGGTLWAEFTIPASEWNPIAGAKARRKPLSEEEKARRAEILRFAPSRTRGKREEVPV
jgi:hypothetical protein